MADYRSISWPSSSSEVFKALYSLTGPASHGKDSASKEKALFNWSRVASNVKVTRVGSSFTLKKRTAIPGIVQLDQPTTPALNYFEMKVLEQGVDCKIGIGLGPLPYPHASLRKMPGWDKGCIGYHGDDGCLFNGNGHGEPFGPSCAKGDIMGCGVEFSLKDPSRASIWFTKNGGMVGDMVEVALPTGGLYALIGLGTDSSLLAAQYLGHSHADSPQPKHAQSKSTKSLQEGDKKSFVVRQRSSGMQVQGVLKTNEVTFTKVTTHHRCALVQLEGPGPMNRAFNYFEIEIVGDAGAAGVGIGLGPESYPSSFQHMPGWDKGCIGYHSDDGKLFKSHGRGDSYGPVCTGGDIMGCGVDYGHSETEGVACVWFSKNGLLVGPPVSMSIPDGGFFPLVGIGTSKRALSFKYLGHKKLEPPYLKDLSSCSPPPVPPECEAGSQVTVVFPYDAQREDELTTQPRDKITVEDWNASEYWARGKVLVRPGYFFKAFTKPVTVSVPPPSHPSPRSVRSIPSRFQASFGGSEYHITEQPPDWLECIICQQLCKHPRQSACCGHTICCSCAEEWRAKNNSCPQCRTSPFDIIEDPRAERMISGINAFCRNYELGCNWKGSVTRVQEHIKKECLEELVTCPNHCNEQQIHRQLLQQHMESECVKRKLNCPCCSQYMDWPGKGRVVIRGGGMTYSEIVSSHYKECLEWPVRCPSNCFQDTPQHFTRSTIDSHVAGGCPEAYVPCMCSSLGCAAKVQKKDAAKHIKEDLANHFMFLLQGYNELKSENETLKLRVAECESQK